MSNMSNMSNMNGIDLETSLISSSVSSSSNNGVRSTAAEVQNELLLKNMEIASLQERVASLSQQLQSHLQSQSVNYYSSNKPNENELCDLSVADTGGPVKGTLASSQNRRRNFIAMSLEAVSVQEVETSRNGKRVISSQKERIGRTASIATRNVLDQLSIQQQIRQARDRDAQMLPPVIQRVMDMFENPTRHMEYLNSIIFAKDVMKLCRAVRHILDRNEPRVVFLQSPAYVFGDIHGNLEDLHFFSDNVWRLGMSLTAGNFLFLGDYVDRGMSCLETVAYLFAMKQQLPTKVYLLRGNHETRDVNGWEEHYGERSFIFQCRSRFGDDIGYRVWEACNSVFDRLPLAAVIDQDIFCVHGGIPRPVQHHDNNGNRTRTTTRIQDILTVPKVAGINPPYEHEDDIYQQVASDCIWSDPASEEQEMTTVDPESGFGESLRGGGAICFGNKAVTEFLSEQNMSYIMRAHEAHAEGVAVSKGARVFTVFSTSQDHNQGSHAMAGCILVDNDKLQVINRSPAYKNQYVHRRDSVSLINVSDHEIQQRIKLGLVTNSRHHQPQQQRYIAQQHCDDDDEDDDLYDYGEQGRSNDPAGMEEWDDLQDSDVEENVGSGRHNNKTDAAITGGNNMMMLSRGDDDVEKDSFIIDMKRRSSVDLDSLSENLHDMIGSVDLWENSSIASDTEHNQQHSNAHHQIKRQRSKRPSVTSIQECDVTEDEEIDTVLATTSNPALSSVDDVME